MQTTLLDNNMKAQLKGYLEKLVQPIELIANANNSDKSAEMLALLNEIGTLSDKIAVKQVSDETLRKPSFLITRPGQNSGLRFAGIPLGHEFSSLVLALLQVGGHPSKEDAKLLDAIGQLTGEFHFETYYSLSCHNCPDVVQALNLMTILNSNITHTAIDGALFQDEITDRNIMGVPAVFLNGQPFGQGRMTLAEIVNKVDTGAAQRVAQTLSEKVAYDVLIVGSGPAGVSAAIYAARKGIRTGLICERFGGQILDTVDIENYISMPKTEGAKLAQAFRAHVNDYAIDVIENQSVTKLMPAQQTGGLHQLQTASGATLKSRSIIIATGAHWRNMGVPGEQEYRTRGVTYCPHCDGPLFKGKKVAVIGGGNSGAEAAIDLAGVVEHVTLLEFLPELKADSVLQTKLGSLANVHVITNAQTLEVTGDGTKLTHLRYKNRLDESEHQLELAGIFVQIGLLPNTQWLEGTIERNRIGEIVINAKGETNIKGIFAAGDCTVVPYKQIIIATGEGAKASLSAFDYLIRTPA